MKKNNKAFTLIELLVVVVIVGILAAAALPRYFRSIERSYLAEALTYNKAITDAQERYFGKKGVYTSNFRHLDISLLFDEDYQSEDDKCQGECFNTARYSYQVDPDTKTLYIRRERATRDITRYFLFTDVENPTRMFCAAYTPEAEDICEDIGGVYYDKRDGKTYYQIAR